MLRLIALGHTNSEIAEQLFLSTRTVETHRAHIQQKIRRTSRAELVRYALEHGPRRGLSPACPAPASSTPAPTATPRKIAARIADVARRRRVDHRRRCEATSRRPTRRPPTTTLVIVGASIHAGHHQQEFVEWAKRHRATLSLLPSAFFSVCLTAADDTDESRAGHARLPRRLRGAHGLDAAAAHDLRRRAAVPRVRLRDPPRRCGC